VVDRQELERLRAAALVPDLIENDVTLTMRPAMARYLFALDAAFTVLPAPPREEG
jgi:hypothetical protein